MALDYAEAKAILEALGGRPTHEQIQDLVAKSATEPSDETGSDPDTAAETGSATEEVAAPVDGVAPVDDGTSSDPSVAPIEPQGLPETAPASDPEAEARAAAYAAASQLLVNAGYTVTPPNPLP